MRLGSETGILRYVSKLFLVIGCFLAGLTLFFIVQNFLNKNSNDSTSKADGFTIESYKVVLDVSENSSVNVKEYITVDFYERGHHGIYKFIPEWLEYTGKDNKTISRKASITGLIAQGEKYTTDTVKGKKRVKIGDANKTLPTGYHTYIVSYTYDMGGDPFDNFDEFIFHAFGDYWGTTINNASVEIHLPKEFEQNNNIHFYADKYRKKDITQYVNYYVSGNTIYAQVSQGYYKLNESLTVDVELPDGYFKNSNQTYGNTCLIICIACIAVAVVSFILWRINGKDIYKVPETVEFYPPENLDASQIGYLYKEDTGRKLTVALIIELAAKGFIKIDEVEKANKYKIMKSNHVDVNKVINREIKVVKLKDFKFGIKESMSTKLTKCYSLMNSYFKDGDEYIVTDKFDEFYEEADYLIKNNYIKIELDTINNYPSEEIEKMKQTLKENEFKGKPEMTQNEKIVYDKLFEDGEEVILSEHKTFYKVFIEVAQNVRNEFDDKVNDVKAYSCMVITSIAFTICVALWGVAYCIIKDLNPSLSFLYALGFIANIVTFIFSVLMKRKNSYGEKIYAKINGFRNYLELAEKDQLEALVEKNPNYFYDILPYAYVLDVSSKWVENFANIPIPSNDNMGTFDFSDVGSIYYIYSSISYPSSGGSSGGCGGGCSSCGGGCSSCGGGGSW